MSGEEPNIEEIHRLLRLQVWVLSIGGYVDRNNWWIWSLATVIFVCNVGLWSVALYWTFTLPMAFIPRWSKRLADRIERRIKRLQQGYEVKA